MLDPQNIEWRESHLVVEVINLSEYIVVRSATSVTENFTYVTSRERI